jgi:hypothetical protein
MLGHLQVEVPYQPGMKETCISHPWLASGAGVGGCTLLGSLSPSLPRGQCGSSVVAIELLLAWYLLSVSATTLADLIGGIVVVYVGNL